MEPPLAGSSHQEPPTRGISSRGPEGTKATEERKGLLGFTARASAPCREVTVRKQQGADSLESEAAPYSAGSPILCTDLSAPDKEAAQHHHSLGFQGRQSRFLKHNSSVTLAQGGLPGGFPPCLSKSQGTGKQRCPSSEGQSATASIFNFIYGPHKKKTNKGLLFACLPSTPGYPFPGGPGSFLTSQNK